MIGRGRIDVCRWRCQLSTVVHLSCTSPLKLAVGSSWYRATRYQQNLRGGKPDRVGNCGAHGAREITRTCVRLYNNNQVALISLKWRKGDATARCDAGHALHRLLDVLRAVLLTKADDDLI